MSEETLTKEQMNAAHFARTVDRDPNLTGRDEERARVWALEMGDDPDKCARAYRLGKEVLKDYTLTYSGRFTTIPPEVPDDVVGRVWVNAGHIATTPAFRLAMFRKRGRKW